MTHASANTRRKGNREHQTSPSAVWNQCFALLSPFEHMPCLRRFYRPYYLLHLTSSTKPILFCRYIRDLLHDIAQAGIGCNIGRVFINILAYADDIVLLAPSWRAMQDLLVILEKHTVKIDMKCNENKTVCMVFQPKRRSQIVSMSFPPLTL